MKIFCVSQRQFLTCVSFILNVNLFSINGDSDGLHERLKRTWLDDLPLAIHQSFLGDVCTNSSKCIVPNSVCVPTDNVYWNRQSFCVCAASYRPSTGQCIADDDFDESTDKFFHKSTKNGTKSSFSTKSMTTGTETPPADYHLSMLENYKQTMERNAVTILPAFFSKLKLSNKTQDFISTMVHQLSTFQNHVEETTDNNNSAQISQIVPLSNKTGTDTATICNGIFCSPILGLLRTDQTSDPAVTTSSSLSVSKIGSSLSKNIEGLLANTPTRVPSSESNSANSLSFPNNHWDKFITTSKNYSKTKTTNVKEIHSKTSTSAISTTTTTAKPIDLYSYEVEYEIDTTSDPVIVSQGSPSTASSQAPKIGMDLEPESNFKYVINPQDLAKQIDLYAILKAAAEDVMKQYLGVLLANSTAFPRLWADVKNHTPKGEHQQSASVGTTEFPKIYEGWMRRPLVSPSVVAQSSTPKMTSFRPYVFKILNKSVTKPPSRNSLLKS